MRRQVVTVLAAGIVAAMAVPAPAAASGGSPSGGVRTIRVSLAPGGAQADSSDFEPAISGDGGYVAYFSDAANLVPGDTNQTRDVFVHDRRTGRTVRASVSTTGVQANGQSRLPSINRYGNVVVYESDATNLVRPDTNGTTDALLTALPRHRGG